MMEWILANKAWLFSGLLVTVPTAIIGGLIAWKRSRHSQVQRSGHNSINIQAAGNIDIRGGVKNEQPEAKGRG
jgi:uncharacterized Tic20 family protein